MSGPRNKGLEEGRGWAPWSRVSWTGWAGTGRWPQGREALEGQTEDRGPDAIKPVASRVEAHTARGGQGHPSTGVGEKN